MVVVFSKGKPKTFNGIKEPCDYAGQKTKLLGQSQSYSEIASKMGGKQGKVWIKGDFKLKGNVWHIPVGWCISSRDRLAFQHPAIFPEALARDHIISWSKEGDVILDPFLGSGTTGKMAKLLNRDFIGIEISPKYLEIAQQRIDSAQPPAQQELIM